MRREVHGILADANCEGQLALLLRLFHQHWRQEVWEFLRLASDSTRVLSAASRAYLWVPGRSAYPGLYLLTVAPDET
jgi:hypothetical protein